MPAIGAILIILLCIALVIGAIYLVLYLLFYLFGIFILVGSILSLIMLIGGLLWGLIIPVRALHREEDEEGLPLLVARGAIKTLPQPKLGTGGWDYAWPNYFPHQFRQDVDNVRSQTGRTANGVIAFGWTRFPSKDYIYDWPWYLKWIKLVGYVGAFLIFAVPSSICWLGIWISFCIWRAIMFVVSSVVSAVQRVISVIMRAAQKRSMARDHVDVRCYSCYRVSAIPHLECHTCAWIHEDVTPGELGIIRRHCGCGDIFRLSVRRSARKMRSLCPHCHTELPAGSGSRRLVVVPMVGSVGAGKTQFLLAGAASLAQFCEGNFKALTVDADDFLREAQSVIAGRVSPSKTPERDRPPTLPFVMEQKDEELEIQLVDAAGEKFVNMERNQTLGYLDEARAMVFVYDPLTLPAVAERVAGSGGRNVPVAQGKASDAYGAAVDRLRNLGEDMRSRALYVVVSKADIVGKSFGPGEPVPVGSDAVRDWLHDNGADAFIRRIGADFTDVTYFMVDSRTRLTPDAPHHPLRVLNAVAEAAGARPLAELEPLEGGAPE